MGTSPPRTGTVTAGVEAREAVGAVTGGWSAATAAARMSLLAAGEAAGPAAATAAEA